MPPVKRNRGGKPRKSSSTTFVDTDGNDDVVTHQHESGEYHSQSLATTSIAANRQSERSDPTTTSTNTSAFPPPSVDPSNEYTSSRKSPVQPSDVTDVTQHQAVHNQISENGNQEFSKNANATTSMNDPGFLSKREQNVVLEVDKIVVDNIENLQERVFRRREDRLIDFNVMLSFYQRCYPYKRETYGRIYTRFKLAEVLYYACSMGAYNKSSKDTEEKSMLWWDIHDWDKLIRLLEETRACCVSKDSNVYYYGKKRIDWEGLAAHETSSVFHKRYEKVIRRCELNKTVSPIRIALEQQHSESENCSLSLHGSQLDKVREMASKLDKEKSPVMNIFQNGDEVDLPANKSDVLELKNKTKLRSIFDDFKEFDLTKLQDLIEVLMQLWDTKVRGNFTPPYLTALGYLWNEDVSDTHDDESCNPNGRSKQVLPLRTQESVAPNDGKLSDSAPINHSLNSVEQLCIDRTVLLTQHGSDPIIKSRELGKLAQASQQQSVASVDSHDNDVSKQHTKKRSRPNSSYLYGKKKSATQLQFTSDIECSSEETSSPADPDGVRLETPIKRRYNVIPKAWDYSLPSPDEGLFDNLGRVVHRRRWTDEEKAAVRHGFSQFGANWVQIKKNSAHILKNRTNVQIKDCYRTMKKLGEI